MFTELVRDEESQPPGRGRLVCTRVRADGKPNNSSVIETDYNFETQSAYYFTRLEERVFSR